MNGDSAEKLIQALQRYFPEQRITFIFGASSDHPIQDMLAALLPHAARMLMVASRHPRAEKAESLTALAGAMGYQTTPRPDVASALEAALAGAGPADLICVTGSLFLVADAREAWLRRNDLPLPPLDPLVVS
jgi:dihydrofolate synthase/folylpolyglutamate synthase